MITTQILLYKDQKIEETIQSLLPLDGKIIIGNCGADEEVLVSCKDCKIVSLDGNRSEIRNKLVELSNTEWQMFIEPGEVLSSGHDIILGAVGGSKRFHIVQDDIISKEVRMWKKGECKFYNPVYENLQPNDAETLNVFVSGTPQSDCLNELLGWKKVSPNLSDVDYYLACQYLTRKEYDKFLKSAEYFLFREGNPTYSTIMIRYYLAMVNLHIKKNPHEALRNLSYCLSHKPLMAEFWCVVGDCFYRAGVMEKAREFFNLAIKMGKGRIANDAYPIELAKYKEYPEKMIKLISLLIESAKKSS